MKKAIIGIDPGASGGIAIYCDGSVTAVKMPKRTEAINDYFRHISETYDKRIVFVEKVQHFGSDDATGGKKFGIAKMMANYQELKTLLKVNDLPYVEVAAVTWQKELLVRIKGETKAARKNRYKDFAQTSYPMIKVNLATSDALCLVSFGRRMLTDNPYWVEQKIVGKKNTDLFS